MKEFIILTLILCFLFNIPFVGGIIISDLHWEQKLEQCAKKHNVYACEYVAVPKKGDVK